MSKKIKGQNDIAWEKLFQKYNILEKLDTDGQFVISAAQIKEFREPRLMAKFDHSINLPIIFTDNNLTILPISRGDYLISYFDTYHKFETPAKMITRVSFPANLQSLNSNHVTSETIAVNCALASGMLEDFLDEIPLTATVSGRMGSGQFNFGIYNCKTGAINDISVNNSQIEIDAAYEGPRSLALIEAKKDLSADFLIRQLYYPFRVWQNRVSKKVRPAFFVYSNGIYRFYEYEFQDPNSYNSLVLIRQKNYSIEDTGIVLSDLADTFKQIERFIDEPKISFPQADSFQRVINVCELLAVQPLTRDEVTQRYAFDIRQTNYYTDAARYLGLAVRRYDNKKPTYSLTDLGKRIMGLGYKQRQLALCRLILQHKAFYEVFSLCKGETIPDKNTIVGIMKQANLYHIDADSTYFRRASTVSGWIHWMLELTKL